MLIGPTHTQQILISRCHFFIMLGNFKIHINKNHNFFPHIPRGLVFQKSKKFKLLPT